VIADTSRSPQARLHPVPVTAVTLEDTFWAPRRRQLREVTLPSQYRQCEETGRIDNFRRAAGTKDVPFQGFYFNDSDVYKWVEATAWALAEAKDPELARLLDTVLDAIAAAQQPDGYLNTYFMFERASQRFTNLRDLHELYCAGHLIQAAIAHHRATGSPRLLEVARRLADLICARFGPQEEGRLPLTDGHPEIEMALVELARAAGNRRYLAQAQFFLDVRGQGAIGGDVYCQDHRPFRELTRLEGHAVRAVYLNAGAADLFSETGEAALRQALDRMWQSMVFRQMYLTGGLGSRWQGEAFGNDYELPNELAYAETCAAIGSVMWNWRMLALAGEARYADVLELALYNGVLAGLGLDGQSYFYQNPLASDGSHRRQPWFPCACCPPNIARLLASLPGYCYSTSPEGVWLHLYAAGTASLRLEDGRAVMLRQKTRYPWDGEVVVEVQGEGPFRLYLRIPGWCEQGATLRINGETSEKVLAPSSYVEVRRTWQAGDTVELTLAMPVRRVQSHPYVAENLGRVALMRGPLVYCLEAVDHPGVDLRDLGLPAGSPLRAAYRADVLGGVVVLSGSARATPPDSEWEQRLYRPVDHPVRSTPASAIPLTAIPYYAWANRAPGRMQVWLRSGV